MNTFLFTLDAVAPIIIVIFVGWFVKKINLLNDNFFVNANKFVFNVAIPTYLFYSVYNIEKISDINWGLTILIALLAIFIYFLATIFFVFYTKDNGKRGVLIQCAFRSNYAIIGIPLASAIGGAESMATAAVVSAIGIPTFNILAVIALSIFSYNNEGTKINVFNILKSICKNPLIIGVFSAIVCLILRNYTSFRIKDNIPFIYSSIKQIGSMASPLALIVLGGRFKVEAVKSLAKDITLGVLWRLVLSPLICILIILFIANKGVVNLSTSDFPAIIAFYGSPVAVSSAIMAESMNCHGELARQLVIWCNIVSIFTVFLIILISKYFSLI